jgi:hypothetical protein
MNGTVLTFVRLDGRARRETKLLRAHAPTLSLSDAEDGGIPVFRSVGKLLSDYTVSYLKR